MINPFTVFPPEQLTAQQVVDNFVEVYTDLPKLKDPINMFIHGPRGAGKSMMLRSLEHEVHELMDKDGVNPLSFFSVLVPIKSHTFGNYEYQKIGNSNAFIVGEHLLAVYVIYYLFSTFSKVCAGKCLQTVLETFRSSWKDSGGTSDDILRIEKVSSFQEAQEFCEIELKRARQYYIRRGGSLDLGQYEGALTSFHDIVLPLIKCLRDGNFVPKDVPICFMIDDADNLPMPFQKVLNSWVSFRFAQWVCFKITTQLGYKTYRTVDNRMIESPHDFSEVHMEKIYTGRNNSFAKRIREICTKRLNNAGIDTPVDEFFEVDQKQEKRLGEIQDQIRSGNLKGLTNLKGDGANRPSDNVVRYSTPALMRELHHSKSSHTYSYAGLQSLTNLSSGVVRWFLEPVAAMYQELQSGTDTNPSVISAQMQDEKILAESNRFREKIVDEQALLTDDPDDSAFDSTKSSMHSTGHTTENYRKLGNLIDGIGQLCRRRLLDSSASEQRLFSIVLSDNPDRELAAILNLGVRLGYLQKGGINSKSSMGGHRPKYSLSRRLGPHYKLDISGYAAHLSVTSSDLKISLENSKKFVMARLRDLDENHPQQNIDLRE